MSQNITAGFLHTKCRNTVKPYLRSNIFRQLVPESKVSWTESFPQYNPLDYTSNYLNGKSWADLSDPRRCFFNTIDGKINRTSYTSYLLRRYNIGDDGRPLNPIGRTGLRGRGLLGRWGPNHAVDPIISRIFKNRLQFIGIERSDTGEWALPGGMVDAGEDPARALIREFTEEALAGNASAALNSFWERGVEIYKGYVDDPRNTDNAWMETIVMNYHDDARIFETITLKAGDDAKNVRWINVERGVLYASHEYFIKLLAKLHKIHF